MNKSLFRDIADAAKTAWRWFVLLVWMFAIGSGAYVAKHCYEVWSR